MRRPYVPEYIAPEHYQQLLDERATRRLREYIPLVWPDLKTGTTLSRAWYLDAIADHLDAVSRFLRGMPGGIQRLLISIVFRSGKSLSVNVCFPSFMWLWDPTIRILSGSYDQGLSIRDTWATRSLMQSATYQRLLVHQQHQNGAKPWALAGDQNVKGFYANTLGGWRMGTQVGGGTGQGGRLVLIDDPLSIDGAKSEAKTQEANDWVFKTMLTRQDDPAKSALVMTSHRTREDDPVGTALSKDIGCEYLELPLEYDPAHRRRATMLLDGTRLFEDPRTEKGASLDPERWTPKVITDLRNVLEESYESLAQQRPERAGNKPVKPTMISRWQNLPAFDRIVQTWDTSFRGMDPTDKQREKHRSQTAGQVWGVTLGRVYLLDAIAEHAEIDRQIEMIREMNARWPTTQHHLIEAEANGDGIIALLSTEMICIPIDPRRQGSKYLRLIACRRYIAAGVVLFAPRSASPELDAVVEQLLRFPSTPNDHVDATTQFVRSELLPDYVPPEQQDMTMEQRLRALAGPIHSSA